jgi:hypothetical protein
MLRLLDDGHITQQHSNVCLPRSAARRRFGPGIEVVSLSQHALHSTLPIPCYSFPVSRPGEPLCSKVAATRSTRHLAASNLKTCPPSSRATTEYHTGPDLWVQLGRSGPTSDRTARFRLQGGHTKRLMGFLPNHRYFCKRLWSRRQLC